MDIVVSLKPRSVGLSVGIPPMGPVAIPSNHWKNCSQSNSSKRPGQSISWPGRFRRVCQKAKRTRELRLFAEMRTFNRDAAW